MCGLQLDDRAEHAALQAIRRQRLSVEKKVGVAVGADLLLTDALVGMTDVLGQRVVVAYRSDALYRLKREFRRVAFHRFGRTKRSAELALTTLALARDPDPPQTRGRRTGRPSGSSG